MTENETDATCRAILQILRNWRRRASPMRRSHPLVLAGGRMAAFRVTPILFVSPRSPDVLRLTPEIRRLDAMTCGFGGLYRAGLPWEPGARRWRQMARTGPPAIAQGRFDAPYPTECSGSSTLLPARAPAQVGFPVSAGDCGCRNSRAGISSGRAPKPSSWASSSEP